MRVLLSAILALFLAGCGLEGEWNGAIEAAQSSRAVIVPVPHAYGKEAEMLMLGRGWSVSADSVAQWGGLDCAVTGWLGESKTMNTLCTVDNAEKTLIIGVLSPGRTDEEIRRYISYSEIRSAKPLPLTCSDSPLPSPIGMVTIEDCSVATPIGVYYFCWLSFFHQEKHYLLYIRNAAAQWDGVPGAFRDLVAQLKVNRAFATQ